MTVLINSWKSQPALSYVTTVIYSSTCKKIYILITSVYVAQKLSVDNVISYQLIKKGEKIFFLGTNLEPPFWKK